MMKLKFPKDIRYANRIWMSMVLVSPILPFLPYLVSGRYGFGDFASAYASFIFASGFLFILYWAAMLPIVLTVNTWKYSINGKKWILQLVNFALLALFLGYLYFQSQDIYTINEFIKLTLSYVVTSSFAIWFFELEAPKDSTDKEFEVIEHLIE